MKMFCLLLIVCTSYLEADDTLTQSEDKIVLSEKNKQVGKIGKFGKQMVWLGGFGFVTAIAMAIEDNDDSYVSYVDPMENDNSLYSRIYSLIAVASLGTSATGLVLYFIDGGTFGDLIKPPPIDSN